MKRKEQVTEEAQSREWYGEWDIQKNHRNYSVRKD